MDEKSVLLISMPFADTIIPSIQLSLLEAYLKQKGINVTSIHLYLYAADIYGLSNYSTLINPPNDPYSSQMIFAKYTFPDHWNNTFNKFREYYNTQIAYNETIQTTFPFDTFIEKTDTFLNWILQSISWEHFDIIGFSLNYGQLLPSLALAKHIKQYHPEKIIVFGGSTTMDELGCRILDTFDYIDYIITGEGEETLYLLSTMDETCYHQIPGIIFRNQGKAAIQQQNRCIDMNSLPFLDLSSFFQNLGAVSPEIQQYFQLNGRIPIEISRGCWWNKCTFCNQSAYHNGYREKHIKRFIDELDYLSNAHNMLSFQVIGSTLPLKNLEQLCEQIISLQKDFSFIAETRADRLKRSDYQLLKQAGFHTIQTGIETFSANYIQKMNKGTRIIDNIAALKYCREYGINNQYNLIIDFPNEEPIDFQETVDTISLFKTYLDPPRISSFMVGFKSPVYNTLEQYNIKSIQPKKTDKLMFPDNILKNNIHFFYDFDQINPTEKQDWKHLVDDWNKEQNILKKRAMNTKKPLDELIFYYRDGKHFIKIYDKRNIDNINIYILNNRERNVFLACQEIITFEQLIEKTGLNENDLQSILKDLVDQHIIYQEDSSFLSLPLHGLQDKNEVKQDQSSEIFHESILHP